MKSLPRVPGVWPIAVLAIAALAAGGRIGAAIGGVAGLLLLLGIVGTLGALRLARARASRVLPEGPLEAGDDVLVHVYVDLPRLWPLLVLAAQDLPAQTLGNSPRLHVLCGTRRRLALTYTLSGVPRGVHRFRCVSLDGGDVLPLSPRHVELACPGELLVYPRRVRIQPPPLLGGTPTAERLPRSTRDFQPGDAPGRLHAARTAQRGFPQVREFEPAGRRPRILMLWAPDAEDRDVELALSCAASLATSWLGAGEAVGLSTAGAPERSLPAQRGPDQAQRILTTLAALTAQDLSGPRPPRGAERGERWLLTTRPDVQTAAGTGTTLRIGSHAGEGALLRLSELAGHLQRLRS